MKIKEVPILLGLAITGLGVSYALNRPKSNQEFNQGDLEKITKLSALEGIVKEGNFTRIILERDYSSGKPTMGELYLDSDKNGIVTSKDQKLCDTLELPYKDNQRNVSCIPEGVYMVEPRERTKKIERPHFRVLNVPGRSDILIHYGNSEENTEGCILVGKKEGRYSLIRSQESLAYLRDMLQNRENLLLEIMEK